MNIWRSLFIRGQLIFFGLLVRHEVADIGFWALKCGQFGYIDGLSTVHKLPMQMFSTNPINQAFGK